MSAQHRHTQNLNPHRLSTTAALVTSRCAAWERLTQAFVALLSGSQATRRELRAASERWWRQGLALEGQIYEAINGEVRCGSAHTAPSKMAYAGQPLRGPAWYKPTKRYTHESADDLRSALEQLTSAPKAATHGVCKGELKGAYLRAPRVRTHHSRPHRPPHSVPPAAALGRGARRARGGVGTGA